MGWIVAQGFPESDGSAVNIGGEHLVVLTTRVPELGQLAPLKSHLTALLEVVHQFDDVALQATMDELGADFHLRDTFGSSEAPGALRSSVKQPSDLAYLIRAILAHWDRSHMSPEEAAQRPTTEQRLAEARARVGKPRITQLNPSSDDEAYARSLMNEDDNRPHVRVRRRSV